MTETVASFLGRAALAACLVLAAVRADAQDPLPNPPTTAEFMSRLNVHMSAVGLANDDPRFSWDTHWGGDFDLADYVKGRLTFLADYEAILGHEYRQFDPTQSN